jgi:hypothetical protein
MEKVNNDPNYNIDEVLRILAVQEKPWYIEQVQLGFKLLAKGIIIRDGQMQELMAKLIKDGYVLQTNRNPKSYYDADMKISISYEIIYSITFEGRIFITKGGYTREIQELKRNNQRLHNIEKQQQSNKKWMLGLTIILAIGTTIAAVYYGLLIWDRYNP